MNKEVDIYIKKLKSPQKEMVSKLRKIILKSFPKIEEGFKNGVPWYEGRYYLVGLKDSVNLGFSVHDMTKKEMDLLEGKGKYMRHIKIRSLEEIDEMEIVKLLKMVKGPCEECG